MSDVKVGIKFDATGDALKYLKSLSSEQQKFSKTTIDENGKVVKSHQDSAAKISAIHKSAVAEGSKLYRNFDQLRIETAGMTTKKLVQYENQLIIERRRAHDQSIQLATSEARTRAAIMEKQLREEIASLRILSNQRKEVQFGGAGALIGQLGVGRLGTLATALMGGGGALSALGGLGVGAGLTEFVSVGEKAVGVLQDMKLSFESAGLSGAALNDQMSKSNGLATELFNRWNVGTDRVRQLSAYVAQLGNVTGEDNASIVKMGIAVEQLTAHFQSGSITAEQFAKILARDPEAETYVGRLTMAFPELAQKMKEATNNSDELRIAQEFLAPKMKELDERAGSQEQALARSKAQLEELTRSIGIFAYKIGAPFIETATVFISILNKVAGVFSSTGSSAKASAVDVDKFSASLRQAKQDRLDFERGGGMKPTFFPVPGGIIAQPIPGESQTQMTMAFGQSSPAPETLDAFNARVDAARTNADENVKKITQIDEQLKTATSETAQELRKQRSKLVSDTKVDVKLLDEYNATITKNRIALGLDDPEKTKKEPKDRFGNTEEMKAAMSDQMAAYKQLLEDRAAASKNAFANDIKFEQDAESKIEQMQLAATDDKRKGEDIVYFNKRALIELEMQLAEDAFGKESEEYRKYQDELTKLDDEREVQGVKRRAEDVKTTQDHAKKILEIDKGLRDKQTELITDKYAREKQQAINWYEDEYKKIQDEGLDLTNKDEKEKYDEQMLLAQTELAGKLVVIQDEKSKAQDKELKHYTKVSEILKEINGEQKDNVSSAKQWGLVVGAVAAALIERIPSGKTTLPILGGYQDGTDSVPRTGAYILHEGEAVIDAETIARLTKREEGTISAGRNKSPLEKLGSLIEHSAAGHAVSSFLSGIVGIGPSEERQKAFDELTGVQGSSLRTLGAVAGILHGGINIGGHIMEHGAEAFTELSTLAENAHLLNHISELAPKFEDGGVVGPYGPQLPSSSGFFDGSDIANLLQGKNPAISMAATKGALLTVLPDIIGAATYKEPPAQYNWDGTKKKPPTHSEALGLLGKLAPIAANLIVPGSGAILGPVLDSLGVNATETKRGLFDSKGFAGLSGAGMSIAGGALSFLGLSDGGYTGWGSKHQPAGIVHAGEFVFSADAVEKIGIGNLDRWHRKARGYEAGGYVSNYYPLHKPPGQYAHSELNALVPHLQKLVSISERQLAKPGITTGDVQASYNVGTQQIGLISG